MAVLIGLGVVSNQFIRAADTAGKDTVTDNSRAPIWTDDDRGKPGMTLAQIQAEGRIVNVHEHIQSLKQAPIFLEVMDQMGFQKICLMGSSWFTITLNEAVGFTRYDQINAELIKIINTYPGRFAAWPTIDPEDPQKLEKFKALVEQGATGLKLYVGHGYVTRSNEYIFHTMALDDPRMLPIYAYCQENFLPVCIHINPYKGKPGFAEELIAVLTQFPDLKVDAPHFMLSSIQSSRLREFLDTFPNVYTDVSFGDSFMVAGLKRISRSPKRFQQLFKDYPDRIMFASDLVLTEHKSKTPQWVRDQFTAYLDMLSKPTYTTPLIPGERLNGLDLPPWWLERVLFKNYEEFAAKKPRGTKIQREINWKNMNITPLQREPGQAFPPPPKE